MSSVPSPSARSSPAVLARKPRAVVFGTGIGIFPPLMQRFREDFDVIATLDPQMSRLHKWWYRIASVRWPRQAWYRKWRYYVEKTPTAFRLLTRESALRLRALDGQYDVVLLLGAMFEPSAGADKPLFVFTDSCRWLSSRNPHDEVSHFHDRREEAEWFALEGRVYRSAARIFVGSQFVRDALIAHYGVSPERAVVSGFGAGIGFGDPYEKVFDGRTILYIGKGDFEKKGGALLVRAFEKVRREIPHALLHVVGQQRLPRVEGLVNHGFVRDRDHIVSLMRSAHVFALPSLVDRNPISILEAMAASTPCVVSDYGAIPELVGDAGVITRCNDVDGLAAALLQLLRDRLLARRLGERGRRRFEQTYNWDSVWGVIGHELREVLSVKASRGTPP